MFVWLFSHSRDVPAQAIEGVATLFAPGSRKRNALGFQTTRHVCIVSGRFAANQSLSRFVSRSGIVVIRSPSCRHQPVVYPSWKRRKSPGSPASSTCHTCSRRREPVNPPTTIRTFYVSIGLVGLLLLATGRRLGTYLPVGLALSASF